MVTKVNTKIVSNKEAVSLLPVTGITYNEKLDLINQLTYVKSISEIIKSKCEKSNTIAVTTLQTNLNGKWILGNKTMDSVIK